MVAAHFANSENGTSGMSEKNILNIHLKNEPEKNLGIWYSRCEPKREPGRHGAESLVS